MNRTRAVADRTTLLIARYGLPMLIATCVFTSFLPILSNDFVNWDDLHTFTTNPHYRGLSASHLRWMFTTVHMGHYQPLSWVTHAVVYMIWGMNPLGYHLVNLLLHAANAVLVYFLILALLQQAGVNNGQFHGFGTYVAATVGALFFAIHPLRVEAVAWATERREVLFSFFLLLALLAYLRMQEERRATSARWRIWFVLSLGCYALSLLSKATGLTLPALLLVLDWYPLGRLPPPDSPLRRAAPAVLLEKLPYGLLACAAAATALLGVTKSEAALPLDSHGVLERAMQAMYGLSFYLWKTAAPFHLSPLYPLQGQLDPSAPRYLLSALAVAAITAAVLRWRRRYPWALAAWAAYVVTVSPVLGFVQSGPQIAADRYTYLSCLPWAVLVAAGVDRVWRAWESRPPPWPGRLAAAAAVAAALSGLALCTHAQTGVWRDSLTLWNHVLQIEPTSHIAYTNRGHARDAAGDRDGALADYDTAVRLNPLNADALGGRGKVRSAKGDLDGSLADFNAALHLQPENNIFYGNRANTRQAKGDLAGALADLDQAIRLEPEYAEAYYNRGTLRQARGDLNGALADYDTAITLSPQYAEAYVNRGTAHQAAGDLKGALGDFTTAIGIKSDDANTYFNRANARKASRDLDGAIADYTEAIRLSPQYANAYNNRGSARKAQGDLDSARADYDEALRLNPQHANAYNNRGSVRQAQGDLDGAVADYAQALQVAPPNAPYRGAFERNLTAARQAAAQGGGE